MVRKTSGNRFLVNTSLGKETLRNVLANKWLSQKTLEK